LFWKYALFFCVLLSSAHARKSSSGLDSKHPFLKVKYSRSEMKLARHIVDFDRQLRRHKFKRNIFKKLNNYKNKNQSFKEIWKYIERIKKLEKRSKTFANYYKSCPLDNGNKNNDSSSFLKNYFKKNVEAHCRFVFLKRLTESKSKNPFNDHQYNLKVFENLLPLVIKGRYVPQVTEVLKKLSGNILLREKISRMLTNEIISTNIVPSKKILPLLFVNPSLTNHIQIKGLEKRSSNRFFYKEFRKLIRKTRRHIRSGEYSQAKETWEQVISFHQENKSYLPQKVVWKHFYSLGKNSLTAGQVVFSEKILLHTLRISNGDQRNETLTMILIGPLYEKSFAKSLFYVQKYKLVENFDKITSKLKFWVCYILGRTGEEKLATHFYQKLIDQHPMSYYSILAMKEMSSLLHEPKEQFISRLKKRKKSSTFFHSNSQLRKKFKMTLKRLKMWLALDLEKFVKLEIKEITHSKPSKIFQSRKIASLAEKENSHYPLLTGISKLLNQQKKFIHTFRLINDSLASERTDLDFFTLKDLFPFDFYKKVKRYSKNLNPLLVLSLIRQESAFNPVAKSHAGASGLMQLMPNTARELHSTKRKRRNFRVKHLNNPSLNLRLGIKYFKRLLKKFNGNLVYALSAYNAGEGNLRKWRKRVFITEDPILQIELIPFKETRHYVQFIYRNYFFYKFLKDQENMFIPINESFTISEFKPKNYKRPLRD
jgi:soluble lytic murein transglycosylase